MAPGKRADDQPVSIPTISSSPFSACTVARKAQRQSAYDWDRDIKHALYSICLVSQRFRDVAQPILYHEFFSCVPAHKHTIVGVLHLDRRLMSSFRTVTRRPDLDVHSMSQLLASAGITVERDQSYETSEDLQ
jgi:hypothetical protein